jgi:hypothetical protein
MKDAAMADKEVSWFVRGIPVYGTVTAPVGKKPHSAVVFVAGSGPTDRNWCTPLLPGDNGTARLLAELLAKKGFLTVRYDKIASGPHAQENFPKIMGRISMQTHMDELAGAVETALQAMGGKGDVYALTSSEGAIHAVNYQMQAESRRFKGLVLTGPPGRLMSDLGRGQIAAMVKPLPESEETMRRYDEAMADFMAGRPVTPDPSLPDPAKFLLLGLSSPANLPFARELWMYSLPERLAKIPEPALVLIGKKDLQVDWKVDGKLLEDAAVGGNIQFAYPADANHVLKHEGTPLAELNAQNAGLRYNDPESVLDQEVADEILDWLGKMTGTR